ncbi:hypothetical protein RM531_09210 [Salinisphaera sp. P385]|uniref:Peptidase M61 catalytic domain-containing protein n=1 Tax=Spectribacter acetivorans TaxID=3075603 RepID=A0ABU3B859_9GAMM|nr:hypothetical protein [Salinisphaera sp. P385]MDT0618656.1 hypothetical protein [Salinisphaera sp. P385]
MRPTSRQFAAALAGILLLATATVSTAEQDTTVRVGGGEIRVTFDDGRLAVGRNEVLSWVRGAAHTVSAYYGGFPVSRLDLRIRPIIGDDIGGTAYGWRRGIDIRLGGNASSDDLADDWVLVHEMLHMGHPQVGDQHKWFKEGLATYVEPIARSRVGDLAAREVWAELAQQLPQGQPRRGDRGLDHTPTWGRVYWGGALYFFVADVRIRQHTDDRFGLQDALRAIVEAGGTLDRRWSLSKTLRIGDEAIGESILTDLYDRMADRPVTVDLDTLWTQLGIQRGLIRTDLDDDAPLAHIRRAITGEPAESTPGHHAGRGLHAPGG